MTHSHVRTPTIRLVASFAAPVLAVGLLAACGDPPDNRARRAEAAHLAAAYLSVVSSGEPDHGRSMLQPHSRQAWGTYERYAAAVEAEDWSAFEFSVLETIYCDDGTWCRVAVDVPGGPESVPPLLDGKDGIVFRAEDVDLPGNAEVFVVLSALFRTDGGVGPGPQLAP